MSPDSPLFYEYDLGDVLRSQEQKMFKEIDSIDTNELLNTSVEDLCDYFEREYKMNPPRLKMDEIEVDKSEVQVDVRGDFRRDIRDRNRPYYVKGTQIKRQRF